ncbi:HAD-IIB family hydrolase [Erythrobacter aquimaris]|uniref:sucrose-phosphate synthase n=1 Tax=Qipengyuania aquimaris TaxID=255984 RepID=A0A6I4TR25_9SPHN|nr:HAD-IIB family hydrolase [Qipengyuania aquimaris]MXO97347.1 HAD-IIB family hydrolase [Qipengyuania aquimaris]
MHIVSLALGGCLKAEPVRYGITEDTGGHITYVLGEMEALARRSDVRFAEIITRRFDEPKLGSAHAQHQEWISSKLAITRIDSGNPAYLSKEALRCDRQAFTTALIAELQSREPLPDLIHAHFADAADVAIQIERALGIPFVYTAHSLGMDKRAAMASPCQAIDARLAEENRAISGARAIIGSSRDECERQLVAYPSARIEKIHRLAPGIERGHESSRPSTAIDLIAPFLRDPTKPIVLAVARPVHKKNLARLVEAYGTSPHLREQSNLVILAGLRETLTSGEKEQLEVMRDLVDAIDCHDLYGSVAYPKSHTREQVQALYSLAARTRGVFVNPALMEPYGLTLVEAAAHGLPVVATKVGGPQDIVGELEHGLLVDPNDASDIAGAIERLISDRPFWERCSCSGRKKSLDMNWDRYAAGFRNIAANILEGRSGSVIRPSHLVVSDLDNTLTGCSNGVDRFARFLKRRHDFGFVVATGRSIVEARRLLREWGLPSPLGWITSVGSEIYLERSGNPTLDETFAKQISEDWEPERIDDLLADLPDLVPQAFYEQRSFKRSYFAKDAEQAAEIEKLLQSQGIRARVIFSHDCLLDILPIKAGKAAAMRHVAGMFGVTAQNVFAAGDSGNDADMLTVCENAILVGNHSSEIARLASRPNVYLSKRSNASGTLEGLLAHQRARRTRIRQKLELSA